MIRCVCGVTIKEQVSSQDLLDRMQLDVLKNVLRTGRLLYFRASYNQVERNVTN